MLVSGILSGGFLWVLGVEWSDRFLLFSRNSSFHLFLESSVYRDELNFGVDGFVTSVLSSAFFGEFTFPSLVGVESSDCFFLNFKSRLIDPILNVL